MKMRTYTSSSDGFGFQMDGMISRIDDGTVTTYVAGTSQPETVAQRYTWDLSKSNSIYGTSSTVQPPAVRLIPQIRF